MIKLLQGTQGIGVVLAETKSAAKSVIESFFGLNASVLVQEFIKEAGGADIRCFVVGERVVAAMKRQGAEGEFRSNIHRGGSAELVTLTAEERKTALRAANTMGLNVSWRRYITCRKRTCCDGSQFFTRASKALKMQRARILLVMLLGL